MTTLAVYHHVARPVTLEAEDKSALVQAPIDLAASELAMSDVTSERAAKRAREENAMHDDEIAAKRTRQDDIVMLASPSVATKLADGLTQIVASAADGPIDEVGLSPLRRELARRHDVVAPEAARMLMESPELNLLDILDQVDPMLAQIVATTITARMAPMPTESSVEHDMEAAPVASSEGGAPSMSASMDRLKALIAILILADLLRDSAKEDQAAQLRVNVASTKISGEQLVSAARANVVGALSGLALTAGISGMGIKKVFGGNKDTRLSINNNQRAANIHTKNSHAAAIDARKISANRDAASPRGRDAASRANQESRLQDLKESYSEADQAANLHADHAMALAHSADKISVGQALIQGAGAASQLAMQGGLYAGSVHQQASTLAKSDADVAQSTADTERDAAAAHAEVANKMLQILKAIADQEYQRNSNIVTARAA